MTHFPAKNPLRPTVHGLTSYIDTKAKFRYKKFTCKVTSQLQCLSEFID